MKKKLLIISMMLMSLISLSQECYSVRNVMNYGKMEGVNPNRFTLGVKQITEEMLSEKYDICGQGNPIDIIIMEIKSPSLGISIGPFTKKSKKTMVTIIMDINGVEHKGVGISNIDVKSTFIELKDENIPFETSSFSVALKKGLKEIISKL